MTDNPDYGFSYEIAPGPDGVAVQVGPDAWLLGPKDAPPVPTGEISIGPEWESVGWIEDDRPEASPQWGIRETTDQLARLCVDMPGRSVASSLRERC